MGDGVVCTDINECKTHTDNCNGNATCTNNIGDFSCKCIKGYSGDGVKCEDIHECNEGTHQCHEHATCINDAGGYKCQCDLGYQSRGAITGIYCEDRDECLLKTH